MKFSLFNLQISITKKNKLSQLGAQAKREKVLEKLKTGIETIYKSKYKYSEYRLQKITRLSKNTIRKYRKEIEELKNEILQRQ